jgi:hypothetical protein
VCGSTECYPRAIEKAKEDGSKEVIKFWDHSSSDSLSKLSANATEVAVEAAILPLRDVASLEHDFLGAVFRAAKGDIMPFESEFLEILIDFKWKSHVKHVFMLDWLLYAAMSIAYVAHAMWFIKYSALPNGHTERSMGILLFSIVCFLHLYFVCHEVKQAAAEKGSTRCVMIMTHLRDLWNLQDLIRLGLVSVALVYYLVLLIASSSGGHVDPYGLRLVSTISAITIPLFAIGFLFYLQAIKSYGALVRMVFKIIESTSSFLAVLVILTFGYSASFNLMTLTDYSSVVVDDASWNTYANSLLSSTLLIMGVDVTVDAITETHYAPVAVALLVSFMLLMGVILLNLLIAIMSSKHGEVKAQERASANFNRAGIVVEYEKLMSLADKKRPEYSPKYLQVLRPERVVERDEKNEEMQALEQVVHDKTDELKRELKEKLDVQAAKLDTQAAKLDTQAKEQKDENAGLREKLDRQAEELKGEIRKLSESQMQSTSELKDTQALEQVVHDKTNELKNETSHLRRMLETQAEDSNKLKVDLKAENAELREMLQTLTNLYLEKKG